MWSQLFKQHHQTCLPKIIQTLRNRFAVLCRQFLYYVVTCLIWFECVKNIRYLVNFGKHDAANQTFRSAMFKWFQNFYGLFRYRICLISFPQNEATWNKKCAFRNWTHVSCTKFEALILLLLEDIRIFLWLMYRVC